MIINIAWRNIWRSPTRSGVVIGAIILGIWALIFMISFSSGMVDSYVSSAIENNIGHIQVHKEAFKEDADIDFHFEPTDEQLETLRSIPGVQGVAPRSIVSAMVGSSRSTNGAQILGVDFTAEQMVSSMPNKIIEGDYLSEKTKNPLVIGDALAKKLSVKIRSKVVLTFQDLDGNITAGAFRIVGIFDTGNKLFDEGMAFVRIKDLNSLLGKEGMAHELSFFLSEPDRLSEIQALVKKQLPDLLVESYSEVSPELKLYEGQIQTSATIFMGIIMLALLFGIINTMLMAVLERYRELGMLMAVGMNKLRVFTMIVLETIMLATVALFPGLLLGWGTVKYFAINGIDMSAFSKGLEQFGMAQIIYPSLETAIYQQLALAVAITAVLGALYPAWKAISLKPVEAIRKI